MKRSKLIYFRFVICLIVLVDVNLVYSQRRTLAEKRLVKIEAKVRELTSDVKTLRARISSLEVLNAYPSTEKLRQAMIQANRDAMISDLSNFSANAYQYRIRPTTMGGGGGTYSNYTLPTRLSSTDNATYTLSGVYPDSIIFMAVSKLNLGTIECILDNAGRIHAFKFTGEFK